MLWTILNLIVGGEYSPGALAVHFYGIAHLSYTFLLYCSGIITGGSLPLLNEVIAAGSDRTIPVPGGMLSLNFTWSESLGPVVTAQEHTPVHDGSALSQVLPCVSTCKNFNLICIRD
jgi:hypothetical protein